MDSAYLLRVEGVNLAQVIDDTDQLSVRRGGGLMLLNAVVQLTNLLPQPIATRLQPIATGASIGLFEFTAQDDAAAESVRAAVEQSLRTKTLKSGSLELHLHHATFVVDVAPLAAGPAATAPGAVAAQQALAANRWRQLQQPTLSLSEVWEHGAEPCSLDRTRVATAKEDLNSEEKQRPLCRSVLERWRYGRDARQAFYQRELAEEAQSSSDFASLLAECQFTDDFKQLSAPSPAHDKSASQAKEKSAPRLSLVDKLAVFYVDGNQFGAKGRALFKDRGTAGFRAWSQAVQKHHRGLLRGLLEHASQSPNLWKNGAQFRLETLLWGGDEILWVVPAWLGWELARWFFSQSHEAALGEAKETLTYGCGLVFCHTKAPIKNITALAHRLGDLAKAARPAAHGLAYEVLESFDDIAGSLTEHRRRALPSAFPLANEDSDPLVLDPTQLQKHWETLTALANCPDFPQRQLYRLCNLWRRGEEIAEIAKVRERLAAAAQDAVKFQLLKGDSAPDQAQAVPAERIKAFEQGFGDTIAWRHLLEMLPYLPART